MTNSRDDWAIFMYLGLLWSLNVNKLAEASKQGLEINSLDNPALAQLARGDDDIDYDLDDLYIIGAVCLSPTKKLTSSLICSAMVAGEIYI